jgi:hypothetical protein
MKINLLKNNIKSIISTSAFLSVVFISVCFYLLSFVTNTLIAQAAEIARYDGGVLVYADDTTGVPKYKVFNDSTGFGSEQSATAVGGSAIEWIRLATSPTKNEWIIVTRDAADVIVAQVCTGVDEGLSCGATTTISATAGTHGLRNFDVAYEQQSGDALLVYGTATADELRKIEYVGGAWTGDAAITTTRTTGTVEWVELTSRNASDQIAVGYSDSLDDVSAYRWSGTAIGNEATAVITATAATTDVRKFDVSFEGLSGDMIIASPLAAAGTTALGHMTAAGTWTIVANTEPDNITAFIDLQEPNPIDDDVAMIAHGTATTSNPTEGYELNGATPNTTTTGMVDGTAAVDTTSTIWAANYMMASVAYQSSTYYAVGVFSDVTGADDINWWTMASTGVWTSRTDNLRTRNTIRFTDIFDYPNADKVLLISSDSASDLWADTWDGAAVTATAWNNITSGGALETSLSSATTDVYDFAFRLAPPTINGTLYTDEGITPAASGLSIKIAVGTSTPSIHTATTTSGGAWTFSGNNFSNVSTSTPLTIWLDNNANDATTLLSGFATSTELTGVPLYYNHLLSYGATTSSLVNFPGFDFYDADNDADILYTNNGVASTSANFIVKQGTFSSVADNFSIGGDYDNQATFNANNGTLVFSGTTKTIDGNLTGSSTFNNVSVTGSYTVATATASTTNLTIQSGGSLAAPANLTVYGNFNNQGTFDENGGTLYMENSGEEFLKYLAGRDSSGNTAGITDANFKSLTTAGNYLYVGKSDFSSTPCSQTAGSAIGCELQVFDISSSTNPVYVAGRDASGDSTGITDANFKSLTTAGNYLYVGKSGSGTACSQTAGSAIGCELMVFDISSSTNPVYVAGRDTSGNSAGTGDAEILSLTTAGNYLYVGRYDSSSTACSQIAGSAIGCELQVYDISSSTNPVYVAGRDASGGSAGTADFTSVFSLVAAGNYLYVGKAQSGTACSQTAGSAEGCELQVYNISDPTNPVYVAGRDVSGNSSGTVSRDVTTIIIKGNYLYTGKDEDGFPACSQTAGSAEGCELQVYDISSSTNPVYVAGRDASGDSTGTGSLTINSLTTSGNYLYVGRATDYSSTACSQTAGSAIGCELMVFDISSSTNPVYVAGRDTSGNSAGTGNSAIYSLITVGNYLYVGKWGDATACSQTAGSAIGCEMMVFDATQPAGLILGNLNNTSALGNLHASGSIQIKANASTTDLTIQAGQTLFPEQVSIGGQYTNSAIADFSLTNNLYFSGNSAQTIAGSLSATSSLPNTTFLGTGTKTIGNTASTSNLSIEAGATVATNYPLEVSSSFTNAGDFTSGPLLAIEGNYTNTGVFDNNGGITEIEAYIGNYLTGRDASGDSAGIGDVAINSLTTSGNYLYVGKNTDYSSAPCSQTAGSAIGCELMVFDISSSTNPVYVAGRDASGNSAGTSDAGINSLTTVGNYLYVGKESAATACSQTAGAAQGCELMVFDISSSTNPIYVAGRDASGDSTGTGSLTINSLTTSGNYLYVGRATDYSSTACSQTAGSAIGCELMVFDISSSTNPVYVAGRDASGNSTGTGNAVIQSLTTLGNYLYMGKQGDPTACSQTAGSAIGCELMVFDISSSTNPVYVAGRDASGNNTGTGSANILSLTTLGNYLYVGKANSVTPCSQTAGSAIGCELMVFDIASSTNPVFASGRDASGDSTGTDNSPVNSLTILGNSLYVGKGNSATPCSQTAGSAEGCELQVYDISSSTNPVFASGRDASGNSTGTGSLTINSLTTSGNYLYVGKNTDYSSAPCSQTAGSASSCELMSFQLKPTISGNLTDTSAFADLTIGGAGAIFNNSAETENFTIESGEVMAPAGTLTVNGSYDNQATFNANNGTVDLAGTGNASGNLTTNGTFNNLQVSGNYTVVATAASTTNLTITSTGDLTAPANLTVYGNFNNQGAFDENGGTLYMENSGGEFLQYLAGRDSSASADGLTFAGFNVFTILGNYLYVGGGDYSSTACSQTAGSAEGCELQVYDISSSTNPVYVAGRDASGDSTGITDANFKSLTTAGNYLYVGKNDYSGTACSQTAGSAEGCELMIFDISDPTNPVYVAGRDSSGSAGGTVDGSSADYLTIRGNYLYVGTGGNSTACSQTAGSAEGCELQVYDISSSTNPIYVAGRDASGDSTGTFSASISSLTTLGNYLYVGKSGTATACSQTAGSAIGCELQVYDISDPTNPVYVAGRDSSGDSVSTFIVNFRSLSIIGNYLYVGKSGTATACSQTAGSAEGCELMIFDISDPTNPVYVAGRDSSGSSDGTGSEGLNSLAISGNFSYVGKGGDATACSQTAGSAQGCELQVYDISSSTNPVYIAGRDASGNNTGISDISVNTFNLIGNYLYVSKSGWDTPCSQTAGSAEGCELMVFDATAPTGLVFGNLTNTSTLGNLHASGSIQIKSNASTTDFTIQAGQTIFPEMISISGNYTNNSLADFSKTSNLYFSGTSAQTISGSLSATSSLPSTTFLGTGTKTIGSTASTSNLTIKAGATVTTNYPLEVAGSFTNAGDFTSGPLLSIEGNHTNTGLFDNNGGMTEVVSFIGDYLAGRDASGSSSGTIDFSPIYSIATLGNYLYLGKYYFSSTPCSQTAGSAEGCELMVFDISSTTNPVYVAGRDTSGGSAGTNDAQINSLAISGNYLYVGKWGNSTACSQTAGSAVGCELMVFDISDGSNPVYVAGRDTSGSSNGSFSTSFNSIVVLGNYLYAGKRAAGIVCSQTVGSATGCELMVFDISSSTNPVYVAGRDVSGSSTGTGSSDVNSLSIIGNYLYMGKVGDVTLCSQTAGSAEGCELQVYDISSSTNPVYVAGRDAAGDSTGISNQHIISLTISSNSLYVGKNDNSFTACSQTAGLALGCELIVYDISSSTNPVFVSGRDASGDSAGTVNSTINSLTTLGNYLYVGKDGTATSCSQTAGSAEGCELMVFDITSPTNPVYVAGRDASGNSAGTSFGIINSLATAGNYLYVGKGNGDTACSQTAGSAEGCELMVFQIAPTISGNLTNTNAFADLTIGGAGAVFEDNASTTNLTINSGAVTAPSVLSIGDTFSNYATFNANGGEVVFLGAEHFINGTTTFFDLTKEATGSATTTFEAGSLTTIEGEWKFSTGVNLHALRSSVDTEYWYVDPQGTLNLARLDIKDSNNINVTTAVCASGCIDSGNNINWLFEEVLVPVTLEDHSLGQVSDQFSFQNKTDEPIFAFSLNSTTTDLSITDMVFTLYGVQNLSTTSVASLRLVQDNNNDRLLDGGDTVIDAAGIMNINGQNGAITFSTDFTLASTSATDYLVVANLTGIEKGANLNITLQDIGVTATVALDVTNNVSSIQHDYQANSGGGGASGRVGGSAPAGASVETGGGGGGGGAAGQEADGENIATDPDFYKPTATGGAFNEWTNGANALLSDGVYATAATTNLRQSYNNFNFNIPTGNTIQGLAVKLDASGTTADGTIDVSISWDGGSTYTTAKATPTMSGSDVVYTVGGATDTWGRSWSPTEFTPSNFILRVSAQPSSNTIRLDALEIRIYHQTGGGGGGGGGRT